MAMNSPSGSPASGPGTKPGPNATPVSLVVTSLRIYPVKSCGGIELTESEVTVRGLAHDREWMVVGPDGGFLTQRQHPRLALVRVGLEAGGMVMGADGVEPCRVPWESDARRERGVSVWRHAGPAWDEGEGPARWLSRFLGVPAALVRFIPTERRLSAREWTGDFDAENRFTDGFPVLVLSEESVSDLNGRIEGRPVGMERFRPNVVVSGGGPYGEDRVGTLAGDGIELRLVKPCVRCRITGTDQGTAEVGAEPLRTLAGYRRDERLGGVVFGQNAMVVGGFGRRLRVGMILQPG